MPVLTIPFEAKSLEEAALLENGATRATKSEQWTLVTDGRIFSPETGKIGPVVYKGPVRSGEGTDGADLPPDDALFMFFDETDCVVGILANVASADLDLTIADYLENAGASITVMKTNRPSLP